MNDAFKPMPIKVMADYDCYPLWWDTEQPVWAAFNGEVGNINPSSLHITTELVAELHAWAQRFDAILNREDPASTYMSPEDEDVFDADGRMLARKLSDELGPAAIVRYWRDPIQK